MREHQPFLAGETTSADEHVEVRSPYDDRVVARVGLADEALLRRAIERARHAAPELAALPAGRRADLLERVRALVAERRDSFVDAIVEEAGKPRRLAEVEVDRAGETLTAAAAVARDPQVDALDLSGYPAGEGSLGLVRRVPIGPVLAITPFNFPLNLVVHKVAPALAAGCPIVVKPASQTPSPALMLAEALRDAGAPDGAISVMPCPGSRADALVNDESFRLISFTGSAEVGWGLKERAWRRRVSLELGGNAAVIVEPDAGDLDHVARRIAAGAFGYAGQSCISVQRVLAHREVVDELRDALVRVTKETPVGDPSDPDTVCGPLITRDEAQRVLDWVRQATDAGARVLTGGEAHDAVITPAVLENVPDDQPVSCQEVFGPVAVLRAYDSFDEALAVANDSEYGLQAGLFTRDVEKVRRAWDVLEVGGIIQNDTPTWRADPMPYGGVKDSGTGREGPAFAVREMSEERLLVLRG